MKNTSGQGYLSLIKLLSIFFLAALAGRLEAQITPTQAVWSESAEPVYVSPENERLIVPEVYRTYALNDASLRAVLDAAVPRFSAQAATTETLLWLPLPDGSMERFRVYDAPVLAPALAARYPAIRAYAGIGVDDPTASVRLDWTPAGFHAMIHSARHSTVFIDPYARTDTEHYVVYYKKDFSKQGTAFNCLTEEEPVKDDARVADLDDAARGLLQGDCRLRTYRLALTCTGEYAAFHGGTLEAVVAAMNTSMVRVNGVFERDLNVTMEIVDNNDQLIFLDAATDPFNDGNPGQMIGECHDQCVAIIGSDNFDIGHIFSTQGGGLAGLGVVCNPNRKGNGVTGIGTPVGDPFDIDYVAHEMGHQYGAGHTQNNPCNRSGASAMEPGSASTIMGYAGICSPNVQNNSDDYFHAISIQQMANYINNGTGDVCAVYTETGNSPPTLEDAVDHVLPVATPFRLTAVAQDIDDDALTYCWEQMDNEVGVMPPEPTNTQGPVFRSFDPTESPTRYFPRLSDLVNGTPFDWESLPEVSRDMSFRVTVRDNALGGGCTTEDDVELTFTDAAGPFTVESPNENVTWTVGELVTVQWDVANTDAAPVSCGEVDILLSLDGGFTYPVVMAAQVPNDGTYTLQVPNQLTDMARIMVVCASSIFFDISDENFSIVAPTEPTFVIETSPLRYGVCGTVDSVVFDFDLTAFLDFDQTVNLSVLGVPAGATASFTNNDLTPPATAALVIADLEMVTTGSYELLLSAVSDSVTIERTLELEVTNGTIDNLVLEGPAYGAEALPLDPILTWTGVPEATRYTIEIATNPSIGGAVVETAVVDGNTTAYQPQNLEPLTVYYWRVAADNACGQGAFSVMSAFQTAGDACLTYFSEEVPVVIDAATENTVIVNLNIPDDLPIVALTTSMDIAHTWVGDLEAVLQSPQGQEFLLFDQPGTETSNFGCDEDNLLLTFDDNAEEDAAALAETCGDDGGYAINGTFQSIDPLAGLVGSSALGTWSLIVTDNFNQDGGQVESWSIDICVEPEPIVRPTLVNNVLVMESGSMATVSNSHLLASLPDVAANTFVFTLLSRPLAGDLTLNGAPVLIGDTFTQSDIDAGLLEYDNTDTGAAQDDFRFTVSAANGGWIPDETFRIEFGAPVVTGAAYVSSGETCAGGADGVITVNASGPGMPFTYSLNGGMFEAANVFPQLAAGEYTVEVMGADGNVTQTNTVTIAPGAEVNATATVTGNTISVAATGGNGVLTYSLDGENFQTENEFTDVPNGTYDVIVVDENGCTATATVTINVIVSATVTTTDVICANGDEGTLTVTQVSGGEAPYAYSIDGQTFVADNVFTDLSAGPYEVSIQDAQGNVFVAGTFVINNGPAFTLSATADQSTITATPDGGVGMLQYSIDGGDTYQDSNVFTDLPNGTYVILALDENGCTAQSTEVTVMVVSTNDLNFELRFALFPNPVNTELTLELHQPTAVDLSVRVYDVAGRLLQENRLRKTADYLRTTLDVTQLPAGSYELVLTDGNIRGRARFVKL